jgi:ADP-glucose pyrophosphorylase
VEKGAVVRDSVIMEDVVIKAGAVVSRAMIDRRAYVDCGVMVGDTVGTEIAVIGKERRVMKEGIF